MDRGAGGLLHWTAAAPDRELLRARGVDVLEWNAWRADAQRWLRPADLERATLEPPAARPAARAADAARRGGARRAADDARRGARPLRRSARTAAARGRAAACRVRDRARGARRRARSSSRASSTRSRSSACAGSAGRRATGTSAAPRPPSRRAPPIRPGWMRVSTGGAGRRRRGAGDRAGGQRQDNGADRARPRTARARRDAGADPVPDVQRRGRGRAQASGWPRPAC